MKWTRYDTGLVAFSMVGGLVIGTAQHDLAHGVTIAAVNGAVTACMFLALSGARRLLTGARGHSYLHVTLKDGRKRYGLACVPARLLRRSVSGKLRRYGSITLKGTGAVGEELKERIAAEDIEMWLVAPCDNPDPHGRETTEDA